MPPALVQVFLMNQQLKMYHLSPDSSLDRNLLKIMLLISWLIFLAQMLQDHKLGRPGTVERSGQSLLFP